jgi:hypothetical protein
METNAVGEFLPIFTAYPTVGSLTPTHLTSQAQYCSPEFANRPIAKWAAGGRKGAIGEAALAWR